MKCKGRFHSNNDQIILKEISHNHVPADWGNIEAAKAVNLIKNITIQYTKYGIEHSRCN
jgi:hypothetical protein